MLYERCVHIIERLIQSRQAVTSSDLAGQLSVSTRTIRSDLDVIDQWLSEFSHGPVVRVPGLGILLNDSDGRIRRELEEQGAGVYIMSSRERVRAITGWLLTESPSTSIAEIADRLQVSPATVSNDLQKVKMWMNRFCIHMISRPHTGIALRDSESSIRRGCVMLLREMLETGTRQQDLIGMRFTQVENVLRKYGMDTFCEAIILWREEILFLIRQLQDSAQVTISDNGFCAMFLYLLTAFARRNRGCRISVGRQNYTHIKAQSGFDFTAIHDLILERTGLDMDEDEMFFIHAQWMSLRKFGASQDINVENVLIAKELIAEVKDSLELEFGRGMPRCWSWLPI